jgi:hypothetical protein
LAIADFYLLGPLNQQLSGRTLDGEQNVLETVTETLSESHPVELENVFLHWKENVSGSLPIVQRFVLSISTP